MGNLYLTANLLSIYVIQDDLIEHLANRSGQSPTTQWTVGGLYDPLGKAGPAYRQRTSREVQSSKGALP